MLIDKYIGVFFLFFQCNSYQSKNMSNMSNYPSIGQSRINQSFNLSARYRRYWSGQNLGFHPPKIGVAKSIANSVPRLIKWLTELLSYSPTWNMRGCAWNILESRETSQDVLINSPRHDSKTAATWHQNSHHISIKWCGIPKCSIPMDPWPLSEKVRLTLRIIVNYTPVPIPKKVRLDP